jgi:hypothetical protein
MALETVSSLLATAAALALYGLGVWWGGVVGAEQIRWTVDRVRQLVRRTPPLAPDAVGTVPGEQGRSR